MIHQAEMVVGMRIPGAIDLEGTCGLAVISIAKVGADAAVFVLELIHRIEGGIGRRQIWDGGIQPATGNHQQREARTLLLEMDANRAFLVNAHGGSFLLGSLLSKTPSKLWAQSCDICRNIRRTWTQSRWCSAPSRHCCASSLNERSRVYADKLARSFATSSRNSAVIS